MTPTDPTNQSLASQEAAKTATGEALQEQLQWSVMETKVRKLITDWEVENLETKRRRAIRKIDVNIDSLRQDGKLLADEVLIGVRVIDENIRKEQPMFVQYLTQSRRLAVFDCQTNPKLNTEPLEIAFTKGMSYSGFLRNIFKCIDGAQTHGWDSVEILFDSSKPLHCGVEHVGHENLIFAADAKDIQAQEFILRGFDVTIVQLQRFKDRFGFNAAAVDSVIADMKARASDVPRNIRIYKYFTKIEGVVHVGWCSIHEGGEGSTVSGWLKDPKPLDMGRRTLQDKTVFQDQVVEVPDTMTGMPVATTIKRPVRTKEWVSETEEHYPIKIYLYSESEEQCITSQKGRVFFDNPFQEAQIALRSLFINGAVRASNVYAAPSQPSATGAALRKLDNIALEHGCIYSEPMDFFHVDYPPPEILIAADNLDTRKAQEMGQTASAVINRDDARKTAEELKQAKGEQMQLGTIPIMLFSGFMREVLSVCWYIVQSQAIQNLVLIMPFELVIPAPTMPGMPPMPGKSITINDPTYIAQTYDIKPSGDTDVIRRAEKIERRMLLLPIIQPTAAYPDFLMDLITELLPEDAEKYNNILKQGIANQQEQMIALATMLQEAVTGPDGNILPEFQPFAGQLQQMFSMIPQGTTQNATSNKPNKNPNSQPSRSQQQGQQQPVS